MEALVKKLKPTPQREERFSFQALAPAAAAICYPVLLRAFHAIVGGPHVTPSPLAILGAIVALAVAFAVPFFGIAMAQRPSASPGTRRLAYVSVAAPTLYVFLGVVQTLVHSRIP